MYYNMYINFQIEECKNFHVIKIDWIDESYRINLNLYKR